MQDQEPQPKATKGNATERLQIRYMNSRSMKEKISYAGLIPGTNSVIVRSPIPAHNEELGTTSSRDALQDKPQE